MKKFFVSALLFAVAVSAYANSASDSVAMTVAGKAISIDEFLFTAKKNGETDLSNKKSLESFVELFKIYKLKVADAEAERSAADSLKSAVSFEKRHSHGVYYRPDRKHQQKHYRGGQIKPRLELIFLFHDFILRNGSFLQSPFRR